MISCNPRAQNQLRQNNRHEKNRARYWCQWICRQCCLLHKLIKQDYEVRALVRDTSNLATIADLPITLIRGDLSNPITLAAAVKNVAEVYHVAAQYSFYNPDPTLIYQSNVEGTRNLLNACAAEAGAQKIVYTSTVRAIGIPKDNSPGDETTPICIDDCKGHYKRSKFLAEQVAIDFAKQVPIVIVNPSAPVGVRDIKPTPTGRMIVDFLNGKMPAYLDTGLNLIDVEDVAMGHLLAAKHGRVGERYLLGNRNMHYLEILQLLAELSGLSAPKIKIPYHLAFGIAQISEAIAKFTKSQPLVAKEAVLLGRKKMFFNADKAVQELQLPQNSIKLALAKAIDWFIANNYIKGPRLALINRNFKLADHL